MFIFIILISIFFILHSYNLDLFPVFADEAIYIRWAQLIIDDPNQYLFFAMNDGKTPLFIWFLSIFQFLFADPLVAGRAVAILFGGVQLLIFYLTARYLKLSKLATVVGLVWMIVLPYWFFHHRMALMDGALTALISLASLLALQLSQARLYSKKFYYYILFLGVVIGLSILIKIPAVLAIPGLFLAPLVMIKSYDTHKGYNILLQFFAIFTSVVVGLLIFLALGLHPSFGQLFSRSGDFLYSFSEVLSGSWRDAVRQLPVYFSYFYHYLGIIVICLSFLSLFSHKHKSKAHYFFWSGVLFLLPIALMGKVVYARYLMPVAWYICVSAILGLDGLIKRTLNTDSLKKKSLITLVVSLLILNSMSPGINFIQHYFANYYLTPFVSSDQEQYLTEWSAGIGIIQAVDLILEKSQEKKIAIATEGFFGTLPDGLLMYFHQKNVENIYIEGIGQPVSLIPEKFVSRAKNFEDIYLLVNNERLLLSRDESLLIDRWCVDNHTRCLELWSINDLVFD